MHSRRSSLSVPLESIPKWDQLPTSLDPTLPHPSPPSTGFEGHGVGPPPEPIAEVPDVLKSPTFTIPSLIPPPAFVQVEFGSQNETTTLNKVAVAAEHAAVPHSTPETETRWESMLKTAIKSIVSLSVIQVRSFDTARASTSEASGFLVDVENGLVLTNRHVVTAGPIVAEATFWNHEEIEAIAIYRDPLHDFAILKIDPNKVKHFKLSHAIPLRPDLARQSIEVRVVGNDAGEKLSILAGTLARTDRMAPYYGLGKSNDFNTFYFQAASSTSGGSSGSPVLDIDGNAVALNAGGQTTAASSYFLPLDRVVRALKCIQSGQHVPSRGTLQVEFRHSPYDKLKRLGLRQETESIVRATFLDEVGMLTVYKVLPDGPGHCKLQPGDIITRVNGDLITTFLQMEETLDSNVGASIKVEVERGGEVFEYDVDVDDLHRITPSEFVEYSGGIFHNVSYHIAHSFGISVSGVFVANPGYAFALAELSRFCLIQAIDGVCTPTIEDFIQVLSSLPNGKRVSVKFCYLHDLHRQRLTVLSADRKWFAFRKASRNDVTGIWDYEKLSPADSSTLLSSSMITAKLMDVNKKMAPANLVSPSFCVVNCRLPFLLDGCGNDAYIGLGMVASKKYGLVVCDRGTVPMPLSDIHLTFSNTSVVSARCIFIHPIQNFCVLQFDASLLPPDSPVEEATFRPTPMLEPGEAVSFVGMSASSVVVCRQTRVTAWAPIYVAQGVIPKYRPYNFETFGIQAPAPGIIGAVVVNDLGEIRGIWATFTGNERAKTTVEVSSGIGMDEVCRVLNILTDRFDKFVVDEMRGGDEKESLWMHDIRSLFKEGEFGRVMDFIELYPISLAAAKALGLPDERVSQLESLPTSRNKTVLQIIRKSHLNPVADLFCEGDMVVAVEGEPVCRFRQVYDVVVDKEEVELTIVRDKKEMNIRAKTSILNGMPIKRAVGWSGALFQEPHAEVAHFSREIPTQIYVCWVDSGSPAEMCRLYDNSFIMEVNGKPVFDLDDLVREISGCRDGTYVRLKIMDAFRSTVKILAIRVQSHYFPVYKASQMTGGGPVEIKIF